MLDALHFSFFFSPAQYQHCCCSNDVYFIFTLCFIFNSKTLAPPQFQRKRSPFHFGSQVLLLSHFCLSFQLNHSLPFPFPFVDVVSVLVLNVESARKKKFGLGKSTLYTCTHLFQLRFCGLENQSVIFILIHFNCKFIRCLYNNSKHTNEIQWNTSGPLWKWHRSNLIMRWRYIRYKCLTHRSSLLEICTIWEIIIMIIALWPWSMTKVL